MIFHMAANKKCHQHLANKDIIDFMTQIFQAQFHQKYRNRAESIANMKTIKNILHIFARLLQNSAVSHDILERNVIPIFSRVEQHLDAEPAYGRDMMYINKKLNRSLSPSSRIHGGASQFVRGRIGDIAANGDDSRSTFPRRKRTGTAHAKKARPSVEMSMSPISLLESYV